MSVHSVLTLRPRRRARIRSPQQPGRLAFVGLAVMGFGPALTPAAADVPPGTFNVQVQAIEVTQGVRGEIPYRDPPDGDFIIPNDFVKHVANRRTVVRVYGWVEGAPGVTVPPLTARLNGYDGFDLLKESPLPPVNELVALSSTWSLDDMRASSVRSWSFAIPESWIDLPLASSLRILTFEPEINPPGPAHVDECPGCENDNTALLTQEFEHVLGDRIMQYVIRPIFIRPTYALAGGDSVTADPAPFSFLSAMLQEIDLVYPNSTRRSPRLMYPAFVRDFTGKREATWSGQIRRFLPGGALAGVRPGDHYIAIWPTDGPELDCRGGNGLDGFVSQDACDLIFRHELAHSQGRMHPGGHETSWIDPSYPGAHGEVGADEYGYDLWSHVAGRPRMPVSPSNPEGMLHDYMSGAVAPKWSSLYTWTNLISDIRNNVPAGPDPGAGGNEEHVLVSGRLEVGVGVSLEPLFETSPPVRTIAHNTPYQLEFRDVNGTVLAIHGLPQSEAPDGPDFPAAFSFSEIASAQPGWVSLSIVEDGNTLYEATRSPGVPQVFLFDPTPGQGWQGGMQTMQWQAFDPDNDPMIFRAEASPDGGQTWYAVADETDGFGTLVDVDALPGGGGNWLVRVQVSDGLNWGASDLVDVNVGDKPPWAQIVEPQDGRVVVASPLPLPLRGSAGDWIDGLLDGQNLRWFVDGQLVAFGMNAELSGLAPGDHEIELTAANGLGLAASDTISVTVIPAFDAPSLLNPPDGANEPGPDVELIWSEVLGATMHDVQVSLDANMTSLEVDVAGHPDTSFIAEALDANQIYYWRARGRDIGQAGPWSAISSFTLGQSSGLPTPRNERTSFHAAPNPLRNSTSLGFRLDREADVRIRIVNVAGREVTTLLNRRVPAGRHRVTWKGTDDEGRPAVSGVYYAVLEIGRAALRKTLILAH